MTEELKCVFEVEATRLPDGNVKIVATNHEPPIVVVVQAASAWKTRGIAGALEQLAIGLRQWQAGVTSIDARPTFRNRKALRETTRHRKYRRR